MTRSHHLLVLSLVLVSCGDHDPAAEIAVLDTSMGRIKLKFYPEAAPLAVENFKGLVRRHYYDGVLFHRVIEGFIIQAGDRTGTGFGGESIWGEPFEDEFDESLRFDRAGQVGMTNAGPNTNRSQFFITLTPTPHLNDKHTIFASVESGMDVAEAISKVETDPRNNHPIQPVVIESARIVVGEREERSSWSPDALGPSNP